MTIEDRIIKTRITLLRFYPFFGILSLRLQVKEDKSISTAATNGNCFYYNPEFLDKLDDKELAFIIVHETMHCALKHIWRKENKQMTVWNMACDYAIHSILKQDYNNNIKMLDNCLYDPKYDNMSAEEIYDALVKEIEEAVKNGTAQYSDDGSGIPLDELGIDALNKNGQQNNKQQNNGKSNPLNNADKLVDDHSKWGEKSEDESQTANEQDWEAAVVSAAKQVQNTSYGNVPAYFKRYINEITNPQKDWRVILREFIEPEPDDYTFVIPDYRLDYDTFGCFLPSFNEESQTVNGIYFWIDTSGSVGDKELQDVYSEVAGAINQFDKFTGYLGFFDSKAYEPKEFTDIATLKDIIPQGGGGTSFHAPFDYLNKNNIKPKMVVVLTDGYCDYPNEDIINCPVVWLMTSNEQAPWGKTIKLN